MTHRFRKTKLSLGLVSALVGSMAATNIAQAVPRLDNANRLGDAAIYQYFSVQGGWQTFFRLINTSNNAVLVKVRFREAANSREILDFFVALSPNDMWSAWTSNDPTGTGTPGIRTKDTSCLFPLPDTTHLPGEGWKTIDADTYTKGADFKTRAFTGIYDDGYAGDVEDRLREGHVEVLGIAQYGPSTVFGRAVTHDASGVPNDCNEAWRLYQNGPPLGFDVANVLGANAYLVNLSSGQGAGYDPDMIAQCNVRPNSLGPATTDTVPDLDDCDPNGGRALWFGQAAPSGPFAGQMAAINQALADGDVPQALQLGADINGDAVITATTFSVDVDGDGQCTNNTATGGSNELAIAENDVPPAVYDAAREARIPGPPVAGCQYTLAAQAPPNAAPLLTSVTPIPGAPVRIKQKGLWANAGTGQGNQWPVTGGVDAVSAQIMRSSVINEWAASENLDAAVRDYFTQWVLTFPTKHYYVDLYDDPRGGDDISPTLVDVGGDLAFAPFTRRFAGQSCEGYRLQMWNREERWAEFTSPRPGAARPLCWETNVLNFNERYANEGLDSNFASTVPAVLLPSEVDGSISERGWARLSFTNTGAVRTGLIDPNLNFPFTAIPPNPVVWTGLPVTGFLFSVYNTGNVTQNHTTINAHKYQRATRTRPNAP